MQTPMNRVSIDEHGPSDSHSIELPAVDELANTPRRDTELTRSVSNREKRERRAHDMTSRT